MKKDVVFTETMFELMKKRGNDCFCFYCIGGVEGFTAGPDGKATNCEGDKAWIYHPDGKEVTLKEAIENSALEPHITRHPAYPDSATPSGWLNYPATFDHSQEFIDICSKLEYIYERQNLMAEHDPVAHADGIVKGAGRYHTAAEWIEAEVPEDFPFDVHVL
jgi:hypothetical protein